MRRGKQMENTMINRRTAIGAALVAASPLLFPARVGAQEKSAHADAFVILLKGIYQPVVHGPISASPRWI